MHAPNSRHRGRGRRPDHDNAGRAWFREFLIDFRHGRPSVRRGDVRTAVLAVLKDEPMHGYQVIRVLEDRSGGHWRPSAGSIYPTLQQLEDEGLVRSEEIDGRRTYRLTDEGHAEAADLAEHQSPLVAVRMGRSNDASPDVRRDAIELARAAMQVAKVGSPTAVGEAHRVLVATRRDLYRLLADDGPAEDEA
jgi:DNA-binding PadR family transcriptional regulator